jgi:fructokinase
LSTDVFGQQLAHDLEHSHVDVSFAMRSDLPTTLAFVQLRDGHATYTFYDENTAGRSLLPEELPDLPAQISALYFGGISLISEPCAEFYAALAEREAGQRCIALDPNIRPGFVKNAARYRARLDRMIAVADLVKVSDEDLDWIVPGETTLDQKVHALLQRGPKVVVLTRGSAGASAWQNGYETISVPARQAVVVDTVGAGDTFNAGMLASLFSAGKLRKASLAQKDNTALTAALAQGAAVAAVTVSRPGANPPWAEELNEHSSN